jgi:hypothetical protein
MKRTPDIFALVVAAAALVGAAGCDFMPDREFAAVEGALALTIVDATRSESAGSVDFAFELKNQGGSAVRACLGPSRNVSGPGGVETLDVVHHPGCMREFAIEPGKTMRWHEALPVSGLSRDRVEVEVEIQVVNPRRCGGAGCQSIHIKSTNKREVS